VNEEKANKIYWLNSIPHTFRGKKKEESDAKKRKIL